ncbi:MAG: PQQ-binding-like beta-propeller repeat protein, partial [Candidatus Sulfotelmatobacter sp.]
MSNPSESLRSTTWCALLLISFLLLSGVSNAAPLITLSQRHGPPTSRILVSGCGFGANVGVDIFFDILDEALVVTDATGKFNIGISAPRAAHPGIHWITALQRNNFRGAQQPFLVQTNWSQFRFAPEHDGVDVFENVLSRNTVGNIGLNWSFSAKDLVESSPAVADGVVYIGSEDTNVYALHARTGSLLWSYPAGESVISAPAVANGIVYVGSGSFDSLNHNLYALKAKTGALLWSYPTGNGVESSPAVENGVVYVGSDDGNVYALNGSTGSLLWSYSTGNGVYSSPAVTN